MVETLAVLIIVERVEKMMLAVRILLGTVRQTRILLGAVSDIGLV